MDIIEIQDVHKTYGKKNVLKGVNLKINEGETLVILGRSGVGKSVLLRHILGLEKPDRGKVCVRGACISHMNESERLCQLKDMGMLFQSAALFDSLTVGENIGFYLYHHKTKKEEISLRVSKALSLVGLEGTEKAMPSDLSGGMRKRAALARLIVYEPKILLYDEPTTGLDPITAMQINELILKVQKKLNATSIVVTHDLCSAFHVADRIALHHEGEILFTSPKKEFVKNPDPLVQSFLKNAMPSSIVRNQLTP